MESRLLFDEDEQNYDRFRPLYPDELFQDIVRYAELSDGGCAAMASRRSRRDGPSMRSAASSISVIRLIYIWQKRREPECECTRTFCAGCEKNR